jgi:Fe(3+) dicitrate transport protein
VNGWRPNSNYNQFSGYGKIQFTPTANLKISLEYSALRNRIHMPGGFSDAQYKENDRASFRARNWLKSPWNVGAFKLEYIVSKNVSINFTSSLLSSGRLLVWKNEDGGPEELDIINPATGTYGNREVGKENFLSTTNELRVTANYKIAKTQNTVAGGVRFFYGKMHRQGGGLGTTGSDFDLSLVDPRFGYDLDFTTINVAPFVENIFRVTDKFSITPGFRFEFINSAAKGYKTFDSDIVNTNSSSNRYIPLAGIGLQYKTTSTTSVYGNFTQAYRPTDYSQLSPIGTTSVIDPKMKDANGFNADLGFRGTLKNFLSFDIGAFYLQYNNRIGLIEKTDANGNTYTYRTNVANSRHVGAETYVEINPVKAFSPITKYGTISFFNSFTFIDARYVNGSYKNNFVENAPRFINRFGTTFAAHGFSVTLLVSHVSKSYADADNTVNSNDAVVGIIPAYTVLDLSASYKFPKYFELKAGLNNLTDTKYFTKRTDEYPGPGIIPSMGRSFYVGLGAKF